MTHIELQEELSNLYTSNADKLAEGTGSIINEPRPKAFEDFKRMGIPTRKDENYKYTDLMNYLQGDYSYDIAPSRFSVKLEDLFRCDIPNLNTHIILVLNGFYYKHSPIEPLPKGVIISSLAEASLKYPEIVNRHYAKYANTSDDSLAALNTLFAQDGIFIYVPRNVSIDKPIQIVNVGFSLKNLRITRRNLVVAEEGSKASMLVCDHTLCDKSFITNSLTEIYVGPGADFELVRMQNENSRSSQIANISVYQEAESTFTSNTLSLHGGLIRNNIFVKLAGERAFNKSYGIFYTDDHQHIGIFTFIHHAKPHCQSDQLFKGILDGEATGAFNGKILVDKYAVKTLAYQRNSNILLSNKAKMNSKPQLEIYNDDVKCSHGATDGQLDTEGLFYLRSRGIGNKEARQLMMYAFANEVMNKITLEPLRDRMNEMIDKRLRGELAHCENCNVHHF